jgi:hypothetical protein
VPAFLFGTTMGSEAEDTCDEFQCSAQTGAYGGIGALRFGVAFADKLRFELGTGVFYLTKKQRRRFTDAELENFESVTYSLSDKLRVRGPFVSAGLSLSHGVSRSFDIGARLHLGLSQIFARHRSEGVMQGDSGTAVAHVGHSDAVQRHVLVFGWPEAFATFKVSSFRLGAGLGGVFLMNRAAKGKHGWITPESPVRAPCDNLRCAPASDEVEGERPFGPSALFSVSAFAGWAF